MYWMSMLYVAIFMVKIQTWAHIINAHNIDISFFHLDVTANGCHEQWHKAVIRELQ